MSASTTGGSKGSFRRKATIGAALGLVALGLWLGNLFKGIGPGGGSDGGAENTTSDLPSDTSGSGDVAVNLGDPDVAARSRGADGSTTIASEVVGVLLFEGGYQLPRDPASDVAALSNPLTPSFAPATLDEVVARARTATGNANGIKVLIFRHKSSTVGAKSELIEALHGAGILDGEIHQRTDYYD